MREFVVVPQHGSWSAWDTSNPLVAGTGETPGKALSNLFRTLNLTAGLLEATWPPREDRLEFVMADECSVA